MSNKFLDKNMIILYQMGKVGSSFLETALPVTIHRHSLYGESPCSVKPLLKHKGWRARVRKSFKLRKERRLLKSRHKIKIISAVRDPYTKNVSHYFQDLPYWLSYNTLYRKRSGGRFERGGLLEDVFLNCFNHDYSLNWFDAEFKKFTGVDIYDYPFDHAQGYQIIDSDQFDIFIYRLEDFSKLEKPLSDFCNESIKIEKNINTAEVKWYNSINKSFKSNFKPSNEYLNYLYTSKLAQHFYSEEELNAFYKKNTK